VLAGVYLTAVAGWPVVVIGLTSILAGVLYTAGPYPLAYIGLGDIFVMVFFGFVAVGGTVFVVSGELPESVWWLSAAVGALTVNILVVNNIRDIEADRKAGRKNIPVLWGRAAAETEYTLMLLLAYAAPVLLVIQQIISPWALLVLLSLPQAVKLIKILRSGLVGLPLNSVLGQTAQLLFRYCVLLAVGLVF
jgi:1,4-dihydroxy-2-naphthoate octaprenyltransferase